MSDNSVIQGTLPRISGKIKCSLQICWSLKTRILGSELAGVPCDVVSGKNLEPKLKH